MHWMAGGCILGECKECNDLVYEDEFVMRNDGILLHENCKRKYLERHTGISQEQFNKLDLIKGIRKELKRLENILIKYLIHTKKG